MADTNIENQLELEKLFSKNQLMTRMRHEFEHCETVNFVEHITQQEIPVPFGIDVLVQIALYKRADLPTMIGLLHHHLNDAQATADMLLKCAYADLIQWDGRLRVFILMWNITADVQADIDRFQYPLPMVVEPKTITNNKQSGYYLPECQGSVILRKNHTNDDVCLDHLNRMNRMRFTINHDVVRMVKNKWRGLDKPKECETWEDYQVRVKAFDKYDRTAKAVMNVLSEATPDGSFHLTHKYDKRGRTYACGYQVNYQGNDWNKAVIEFAERELVS